MADQSRPGGKPAQGGAAARPAPGRTGPRKPGKPGDAPGKKASVVVFYGHS
jgi:hypothetical protein